MDVEEIDEDGPLLPELFTVGGYDEEAGVFWDGTDEDEVEESTFTETPEVPGRDTAKAEQLLSAALRQGAARLSQICRSAVKRHGEGLAQAESLFTDDERQQLADQIAATNGTAELLGRSRIREREAAALKRSGRKDFAEPVPFHVFDEGGPLTPLAPTRAIEYFRKLVPTLSVPETWAASLAENAFTIAGITEQTILDRLKAVIQGRLETGEDTRGAVREIDALLDEAGLTERNSQRSEAIFRTSMMESFNRGAEEEGLEVAETFPVYQILNPDDGRSRPHHAARNRKFYRNAPGSSFSDVRGTDVGEIVNCRCTMRYVDRFEWAELQATGSTIEDSW